MPDPIPLLLLALVLAFQSLALAAFLLFLRQWSRRWGKSLLEKAWPAYRAVCDFERLMWMRAVDMGPTIKVPPGLWVWKMTS